MNSKVDNSAMYDAVASLPDQIDEAIEAARQVEVVPNGEGLSSIVVLGSGASGVAGELVSGVVGGFLPLPVVVHKGFGLPSFVGPDTLVIALSFSGEAEETLQATEMATDAGARLVVCTTGGALARYAEGNDQCVIPVADDIIASRAALGALSVPPLIALERMGLYPGATGYLASALTHIEARRDRLVAGSSGARELAEALADTAPVIMGGGGPGRVAASRWKSQLNDNAKMPAFVSAFPEATHSEANSWMEASADRGAFSIVHLRHEDEHPKLWQRFDLHAEAVADNVSGVHSVVAQGEGRLAQFFDLALYGDFVSLHLADIRGVEASPLPVAEQIRGGVAS